MRPSFSLSSRKTGFTLVEMIVAIAILAILVLMINELFSGASTTMTTSRKHMDADSEARLFFNRLGSDFDGMIKNPQVDSLFIKRGSAGAPLDEGFYFYSQAPAYFSSTDAGLYPGAGGSDPKSPISLIGYIVSGNYQLERLGKGLTWDNQGSVSTTTSSYNGIVFLAPVAGGGWDPNTLLTGTFPATIGGPPDYGSADPDFQVIAPDAFRFEFCFLLKDGTLSDLPIMSTTPATWNTDPATKGTTYYTSSGSAPSSTQGYPAYVAGSRWSVTGGQEPQYFICTGAPTTGTNATWGPLGMQDVSAIIVSIAILDSNSQKLLGVTPPIGATPGNVVPLEKLVGLLPDSGFTPATPSAGAVLPAAAWQTILNSPTFAATNQLPPVVASQIRVYQRFFYLNP